MAEPLEIDRYHRQLGEFISMFAFTESVLRRMAGSLLGLDEDGVRAILKSWRAEQLGGAVRRHFESKAAQVSLALDSALKELKEIATQRNGLVHYQMESDDLGSFGRQRRRHQIPARQPFTVSHMSD